MDGDIEMEQVISTALSLEDDYPGQHLPLKDKDKVSHNVIGTLSDLSPYGEIQVPFQNTLQWTLLELYSVLGISQEPKVNRAMFESVEENPSKMKMSPDIKAKPYNGDSSNCLKRQLPREEKRPFKKHRTETEDVLQSANARSRRRTIYSKDQTSFLHNQFDLNPYPDYESRCHISQITGIPEPRIQVWFQNRRARHLSKIHRTQYIQVPSVDGPHNLSSQSTYQWGQDQYPNIEFLSGK